jgi:lipoprotein-releasing system ATP-binding protein
MSKTPILEIDGLEKIFPHPRGPVNVLRGISLKMSAGETIAIVGVSGAGKSTLLHCIGAIDQPSGGKVVFDGVDLARLSPLELARIRNNKIGFVFQFHHLLPEFDALENVTIPALIARMDKAQAEEKARKVLTELGLAERLHHRVGELSGGEEQRVAVARAMILEPKLLLCDEPTGNLDAETGKRVEDLLLELNRNKGVTLIVVTHNEALAARMQRTLRLKNGQIVNQDHPQ